MGRLFASDPNQIHAISEEIQAGLVTTPASTESGPTGPPGPPHGGRALAHFLARLAKGVTKALPKRRRRLIGISEEAAKKPGRQVQARYVRPDKGHPRKLSARGAAVPRSEIHAETRIEEEATTTTTTTPEKARTRALPADDRDDNAAAPSALLSPTVLFLRGTKTSGSRPTALHLPREEMGQAGDACVDAGCDSASVRAGAVSLRGPSARNVSH